jgi:enolase-phosphatase E1
MADYVTAHAPALEEVLDHVRREEGRADLSAEECASAMLRWMDEDRKVSSLKAVQGMIWRAGYESGHLTGHLYPDVAPNLRRWRSQGIGLHVYSSGSVEAQRLLFGHTEEGDLTPLFSAFFDTLTGPKKEAASYARIAGEIALPPPSILFLSDHPDELAAAAQAGLRVCGLRRPGNPHDVAPFPEASDFGMIDPLASQG